MGTLHRNIAVLGSVDSGKITMCAQLFAGSDCVDKESRARHQETARSNWPRHADNPHNWMRSCLYGEDPFQAVGNARFTTAKSSFSVCVASARTFRLQKILEGSNGTDIVILVVSA